MRQPINSAGEGKQPTWNNNETHQPVVPAPEGCPPVCNPLPEEEYLDEETTEATSPRQGSAAAELQQLYQNFIRFFPPGKAFSRADWYGIPQKEHALQELLQATRTYCCSRTIRGMLAKAGLWANDLDNESQAIFDDASHKLMKDLSRRRERREEVRNFAGLAVRICHNFCLDYLGTVHPEKKGEIRLPSSKDYGQGRREESEGDRPLFKDPYGRNEDGFMEEEHIFRDDSTDVVRTVEQKLEQSWLWKVLSCYVKAMLEYGDQPEKVLGLCYGRVLYQMTGRFDPEFGRPGKDKLDENGNYKQPKSKTSPVWAMKQMRGKTLDTLREESAAELSLLFGFPMSWGQQFCLALQTSRTVDGTSRRLADIPYDALCTLEQVRGWCDSIHKTLLPRACKLILQDDELVDYCAENLPATAKAFLNKGER